MAERPPAERLNHEASARPPEGEALPAQFGKYTLMRRLAAGGMAELFLALHRPIASFEKLVVIKRLHPSMTTDPSFVGMLLHEAKIAATLSHPNIVHLFDAGQIDGKLFIAMEYIHGEDLRSVVRAMKRRGLAELPLEHTLAIVKGVCAGLAYAHEQRDLDGAPLHIVHRDVSPQNVLITFTGDVKLVDFGVAKSAARASEDTKDGEVKGKLPYMSPEQAAGEDVDARTDVFAAGVLLFELSTGKRLFKGASERETRALLCDKDYPRPSQVRPGYPPALERIVMKALAKRREERYQSAREMQSDLEEVIREARIPVAQVCLALWMRSLFEEKLSHEAAELADVRQLADEVAAAQRTSATPSERMLALAAARVSGSGIFEAPARRSARGRWPAGAALVVVSAAAVIHFGSEPGVLASRASGLLVAAGAADPPPRPPAPADEVKGWIDVTSQPEGCSIWIDGDLRRETTPARIQDLPLDRPLHVKLTRDGLEPHSELVTLSADAPTKHLSAQMEARPAAERPPVGARDGSARVLIGDTASGSAKVLIGDTASGSAKVLIGDTAGDSTGETASGSAKVLIRARGGACSVAVNGVRIGSTPVEAPVRPGVAKITCATKKGRSLSRVIRVAPGETAPVTFKLQ